MSVHPDLGIDPGQVIRIFGLRRSGNHAIINWLSRNAPGRTVFFNNCRAGQNPFKAHNGIEVDGVQVARPGKPARKHAQLAGDGAVVLVSYENTMPLSDGRKPISPGLEPGAITKDVIIVREFLNWSASLVKKLQGNPDFSAPQRMVFCLRLLNVYSQMLDLLLQGDTDVRAIVHYDAWCESAEHRLTVLSKIGFPPRDDSVGRVEAYGNGSSFQPDVTDAKELRPLDRWKAMQDDPEYRMVLWLVGQDRSLSAKLEQVFPESMGPMGELASQPPYMS